ncbi:MAG: TIGR03435 family protein, partial [Bryobacteraceae bacterium]
AQTALRFEVATIKLAAPNATVRNQMTRVSPNRMSIPSMTLTWLIYTAYGEGMNTSATVAGGPDWVGRTAYAVEGLAHEPATQRQFQAMLRTLLEDRFGLQIRTETKEGNIYALVLDRNDGKLGPKVQPWDGTCLSGRMPTEDENPVTPRCLSGYIAPGIRLDGATMYSAADLLSLPVSRNLLGRVVQDRTGLAGRYKMELEYKFPLPGGQAAPPDVSQPSLFTAIREQWGLKLEPAHGPFKVFAIESAHPPTEN